MAEAVGLTESQSVRTPLGDFVTNDTGNRGYGAIAASLTAVAGSLAPFGGVSEWHLNVIAEGIGAN